MYISNGYLWRDIGTYHTKQLQNKQYKLVHKVQIESMECNDTSQDELRVYKTQSGFIGYNITSQGALRVYKVK